MLIGKIVEAGRLRIEGKVRTGFFVETSGAEVSELYKKSLYKNDVYVMPERRRQIKSEKVKK